MSADLITKNVVSKLRHGGTMKLVDLKNGLIHHIQLNKKDNKICWERWVKCIGATAKNRWVNWNLYLSLKDIVSINKQLVEGNCAR
jgi:hypothetical protein